MRTRSAARAAAPMTAHRTGCRPMPCRPPAARQPPASPPLLRDASSHPLNSDQPQKLPLAPHLIKRLRDLVQRSVAALGGRQAPALGRDRAALNAVGVVDG